MVLKATYSLSWGTTMLLRKAYNVEIVVVNYCIVTAKSLA